MSTLDELYSSQMYNGTYYPYNDVFVGVVSGGGGVTYTSQQSVTEPLQQPIPSSPTLENNTDIKLFFTNISSFKNKMTFNIQNSLYFEGSSALLNYNTINDVLILQPIVEDGFKSTNYWKLEKALINKDIEINGIIETIKVSGLIVSEFSTEGAQKSYSEVQLPAIIDLGFDLEQKTIVQPTLERIQTVYVASNYDTQKLKDELIVKLSSSDLINDRILKLGESLDIVNIKNSSSDLKVTISGLNYFSLKNIRFQYANKFDSNYVFNINDFNVIGNDTTITIPANVFNSNIVVLIEVEPNDSLYPKLTLDSNVINKVIAESIFVSSTKSEKIRVEFTLSNSDIVKVKTPYKEYNTTITAVNAVKKYIDFDLKTDFENNEGEFKIILTPYSNFYGDGNSQSFTLKISKQLDIPIINKINYPTDVYIPSYTFGDVNFKIEFESTLATHVLVYHTKEDDTTILGNFSNKNSIILNYKDLKNRKIINSPLDLLIIPYNGNIKGEIERIIINFEDSEFYISTQNFKDELLNAIQSNLKLSIDKSKYLNHLASFEIDDKQILVSNWEVDNTTFTKFKTDELGNQVPDGQINKSIVLKLYEPLPTTINKNDTFWVSELSALPILQSVILSGNNEEICIPLRSANFNVDVDFVKMQSTGIDSYDSILLSGSQTTQQLVEYYLAENFIDVSGVNIDYSTFNNFIKYSSAVERLANFRYKKELAEYYDWQIQNLSVSSSNNTITLNLDIKNIETKKSNLITGFDGWETYLTQSIFTSSFVSGGFSSGKPVGYYSNTTNLYADYYELASTYDKDNNNLLKRNLPLHIIEDSNNAEFLLFLDMIGNYFDIIWAYIKGITEQKKISETNTVGINDDFLYQYLKSFGWDAKNLNSNKQLWEYTFGVNNDGVVGSLTSDNYLGDNDTLITPQQATKQIWRRIANNLPYLLKHRGSIRGINALLTCYGIPSSNLSIIEFGGPNTDTVTDSPKFIYNSLTHNLVFDNTNAKIEVPVTASTFEAIEFKIKPAELENYTFISASGFELGISVINTNGIFGKFTINGNQVSTSYPFYDGNYHTILAQLSGSSFIVYAASNDKDTIVTQGEWITSSVDFTNNTSLYFGGNGHGFSGSLEELRIWKTALSESVFDNHVINSEAINGNHISASTDDLLIRLDFERPQDLSLTGSINNVAPYLDYVTNVSASGFGVQTNYPFNYEVYEREISLVIPNTGASRYYTNKVRLEEQTLVANLSPTKRATKKAFDTSAKDSNRVGLFFSPNKDLDLDIAKSLGGESLDDYIGNPEYEYGYTTYPELDELRTYYFRRVGERNLYEFIRLVKYYDKSLFINLREMLPARAVVTTGLLIAPHFLERSKVKRNKPSVQAESLEGVVTDTQITDLYSTFDYNEGILNLTESIEKINGDVISKDADLDASKIYNFGADNITHTAEIFGITDNIANGDWITYDGTINYNRISASILTELDILNAGQIIGMDEKYINYGFNTYFTNGYGKYHYEENGVFKSKGIRGFLVTKQTPTITQINSGYYIDATAINPLSGAGFVNYTDLNGVEQVLAPIPGNEYNFSAREINTNALIDCILVNVQNTQQSVVVPSYRTEFIIQELNQSSSLEVDSNIVNVVTASGYLPTHYIYTGDKTTGLQNSYYFGSKQTTYTTIDGKAAVETFTTNPTTLRVTAQGRSNNEPILEVD
jgi:hypothetical protein